MAQGADKTGPFAGVPYDGKLTKADGKGQWWDGLDPQDLYAQTRTTPGTQAGVGIWDRGQGQQHARRGLHARSSINRTIDLMGRLSARPGLFRRHRAAALSGERRSACNIAAHFYNSNMPAARRQLEAVMTGKVLNETERKAMVWDIERGEAQRILPLPWQTDTCIGDWHYDAGASSRGTTTRRAATVVQMLADIVSKNGNLMLNVPVAKCTGEATASVTSARSPLRSGRRAHCRSCRPIRSGTCRAAASPRRAPPIRTTSPSRCPAANVSASWRAFSAARIARRGHGRAAGVAARLGAPAILLVDLADRRARRLGQRQRREHVLVGLLQSPVVVDHQQAAPVRRWRRLVVGERLSVDFGRRLATATAGATGGGGGSGSGSRRAAAAARVSAAGSASGSPARAGAAARARAERPRR